MKKSKDLYTSTPKVGLVNSPTNIEASPVTLLLFSLSNKMKKMSLFLIWTAILFLVICSVSAINYTNVTLPNESMVRNLFVNINFTQNISHTAKMNVTVYVSNSLVNFTNNESILYKNEHIRGDQINFSFISLPHKGQEDPKIIALYHLDNDSRVGETDIIKKDYAWNNDLSSDGLSNAPHSVPGIINRAVYFNQIQQDYLYTVANAERFSLTNNKNLSIMLWVNVTNRLQNQTWAAKAGVTGAAKYYDLYDIGILNDTVIFRIVNESPSFPYATVKVKTTDYINNNQWHQIAVAYNNVSFNMSLYIDGILVNSSFATTEIPDFRPSSIGTSGVDVTLGYGYRNLTAAYQDTICNCSLDEVIYYNRTILDTEPMRWYKNEYKQYFWKINISNATYSEMSDIYNFYLGFYATPNVTFLFQRPADMNISNVIGTPLNLTYNITSYALDNSTVFIYYKANSTNSNTMYFQNGTNHSGYFPYWAYLNISSSVNSNNYTFLLYDNQILPGTYNFGAVTIDHTLHNKVTLANSNSYVNTEYFNVSGDKQWGYFEIMANSTTTGASPVSVYYCNSTYTTGTISTNSNCALIATRTALTSKGDHCHLNASCHIGFQFAINTTTQKIGTVKVTSTSHFIFGGAQNWNTYNVASLVRIGMTQTTTNRGVGWTDQVYTLDQHLHQFNNSESQQFYYYVCANDTSRNQNCSDPRLDIMAMAGLPPSSPQLNYPLESEVYSGNVIINYTGSLSPNEYNISFYNISLLNLDYTFNLTIKSNNSLNLTYTWDTTNIPNGWYIIRVEAVDILGQSSIGYSESFMIVQPIQTTGGGGGSTSSALNINLFTMVGPETVTTTRSTEVSQSCSDKLSLLEKLTSNCKQVNGKCDYGENPLKSREECSLAFNKDIFYQVWFLKGTIVLLCILVLAYSPKTKPLIAMDIIFIIASLAALQGII